MKLMLVLMMMSSLSFSQSVPVPDYSGMNCAHFSQKSIAFKNSEDRPQEFVELVNNAIKSCRVAYSKYAKNDPIIPLFKNGVSFCAGRNAQNSELAVATCNVLLLKLIESQRGN